MQNYTEKHFLSCPFNPLDKSLFVTYPKLKGLIYGRDAKTIDEWEKLMRYIIALYDPGSPLIKDNNDLTVRKQAAAEVAGFDIVLENDYLLKIYTCDDDDFTEVTVLYLKLYGNSRLWTMIQANLQTFWEYSLRLMTPISRAEKDKDLVSAVSMKSKMSEDLETINDRIERCLKKFYNGDIELEEKAKIKRITPESIADNTNV